MFHTATSLLTITFNQPMSLVADISSDMALYKAAGRQWVSDIEGFFTGQTTHSFPMLDAGASSAPPADFEYAASNLELVSASSGEALAPFTGFPVTVTT